jgi:hypothetical protein
MTKAVMENQGGEFEKLYAGSMWVLYVKLPCAYALHLYLYPEVQKGMEIMKFANNQPQMFVSCGSEISFTLGLIQVFLALYTEVINIYRLSYQHTVEHCIIHFVALEVIMELNKLYFESLKDHNLKKVMHTHVLIERKGKHITFMSRSFFHKWARVTYKLLRSIYISFVFYFVPFYIIFLNLFNSELEDEAH